MDRQQVRAAVGLVAAVDSDADARARQDGAFVSYDADGNVLWMAPR